ncbi:type I glyceraldehyde-3-phosphate dehydrogenase [Paenibacillus sp. MBLB4367]|uniref:type I glyceraldehyde-3-phosphate dehydrogenase n=1 Tax=Paenibacillus sp. MBLB4367 TaxID=3384767 RepID=UPI0039083597
MKRRLAISGMGRIGRLLVRRAFSKGLAAAEIAAINTTSPVETVAHLLKYDTVHGKWDADIDIEDKRLLINGQAIDIVMERDPLQLPWERLGIDIAIDATGKFNDRQGAAKHVTAGAGRVILTAPGSGVDLTVVMGVNEASYDPQRHRLLSTASCTTNCLAPILHILDEAFQLEQGWMTTVHAFTNDQNHMDNPHKDLRRARACTQSIIPTSTGVGKALAGVLPHLASRVQGISLRVPTQDVSLVDLTALVKRPVTKEEVKDAIRQAVSGKLAPIVEYNELPLVSSDYTGNDKSAVIDGLSLMVADNQIKLLAWYDNEWAYASRVIDFAEYVAKAEKGSVELSWSEALAR